MTEASRHHSTLTAATCAGSVLTPKVAQWLPKASRNVACAGKRESNDCKVFVLPGSKRGSISERASAYGPETIESLQRQLSKLNSKLLPLEARALHLARQAGKTANHYRAAMARLEKLRSKSAPDGEQASALALQQSVENFTRTRVITDEKHAAVLKKIAKARIRQQNVQRKIKRLRAMKIASSPLAA